ncbi:hypothetical protein Q5P01_000410 [Channa striata]|uniref:Uncharacterized protein n=1 Tax=Channa striata TaxID=64152 RepID=A0AA88IL49_CHASR|nr:hypothetical protein Q5P01_000410 [Channa striata]
MSSVQRLRTFVNERLSAAAEEIVGVFVKTIVEYEEQIRLFDSVWKPEIKLHRIELSRHHVDKEQDVLADLQVCNQDGNPIVHQEDSVPTQVKEKQRASQEEVKQETEAFMLTPTDEFYCSQTDANDNQQLFSHNSPVTESQDLHQQQRDCKEEQVLAEQQLCDPNQSWSQDQEDPEIYQRVKMNRRSTL